MRTWAAKPRQLDEGKEHLESCCQWCQEPESLSSYRARPWFACLLHIRPFLALVCCTIFSSSIKSANHNQGRRPRCLAVFRPNEGQAFSEKLNPAGPASHLVSHTSHVVLHCSRTAHARDSSNSRLCRAHHGIDMGSPRHGGAEPAVELASVSTTQHIIRPVSTT
jgi:hypothetical protein